MSRTIPLAAIERLAAELRDAEREPFLEEFTPHFNNLLRIVDRCRERPEGNIIFRDAATAAQARFDPGYRVKRRGLALFAVAHRRILEVGFNAGFSALLMLLANRRLDLVYVDILAHRYAQPCFDYLHGVFGARLTLHAGDSRQVLPALLRQDNDFSGYLIDGGHGLDAAQADLENVLAQARPGTVLCFDDTDFPHLRVLVNLYTLRGSLVPLFERNQMPATSHAFFRIASNREWTDAST